MYREKIFHVETNSSLSLFFYLGFVMFFLLGHKVGFEAWIELARLCLEDFNFKEGQTKVFDFLKYTYANSCIQWLGYLLKLSKLSCL